MARYLSASEAASLVLEHTFTDSEDESEIGEDPSFPLPHEDADLDDPADAEQPHPSIATPAQQPLPSSARALSLESCTTGSPSFTPTLDVGDESDSGKQ